MQRLSDIPEGVLVPLQKADRVLPDGSTLDQSVVAFLAVLDVQDVIAKGTVVVVTNNPERPHSSSFVLTAPPKPCDLLHPTRTYFFAPEATMLQVLDKEFEDWMSSFAHIFLTLHAQVTSATFVSFKRWVRWSLDEYTRLLTIGATVLAAMTTPGNGVPPGFKSALHKDLKKAIDATNVDAKAFVTWMEFGFTVPSLEPRASWADKVRSIATSYALTPAQAAPFFAVPPTATADGAIILMLRALTAAARSQSHHDYCKKHNMFPAADQHFDGAPARPAGLKYVCEIAAARVALSATATNTETAPPSATTPARTGAPDLTETMALLSLTPAQPTVFLTPAQCATALTWLQGHETHASVCHICHLPTSTMGHACPTATVFQGWLTANQRYKQGGVSWPPHCSGTGCNTAVMKVAHCNNCHEKAVKDVTDRHISNVAAALPIDQRWIKGMLDRGSLPAHARLQRPGPGGPWGQNPNFIPVGGGAPGAGGGGLPGGGRGS